VPADVVADANVYEQFMGAWSRLVAPLFLDWLAAPRAADWVDVGCGTGALTAAVLGTEEPASVLGVDPSRCLVAAARAALTPSGPVVAGRAGVPAVRFAVGHGAAVDRRRVRRRRRQRAGAELRADAGAVLAEHRLLLRPGGLAAADAGDCAEGMTVLREFWLAALEADPTGGAHDEGARFPLCRPRALADLWQRSGVAGVDVTALDTERELATSDDLWRPFLGGQGAAPTYLAGRPPQVRDAVRDALRERLRTAEDGAAGGTARAWAVRGMPAPGPVA
jgi:SAM-dependent methyltransferase